MIWLDIGRPMMSFETLSAVVRILEIFAKPEMAALEAVQSLRIFTFISS